MRAFFAIAVLTFLGSERRFRRDEKQTGGDMDLTLIIFAGGGIHAGGPLKSCGGA
jgi:hypothetical protein